MGTGAELYRIWEHSAPEPIKTAARTHFPRVHNKRLWAKRSAPFTYKTTSNRGFQRAFIAIINTDRNVPLSWAIVLGWSTFLHHFDYSKVQYLTYPTMVKSNRPPANAFVAAARKLYNPIGFSKGYNFILFFIFAGALMGFVLARFMYLDHYGNFCRTPGIGECYWYTRGISEIGIRMHLAAILPAGFLVCFQFVPAIRHKALLVHRVNGYVILILSVVSTVGAFMTTRHAFGGGMEIQLGAGVCGIAFMVSMVLAYVNIKRLQIEQHRAWMLRGWFYVSLIVPALPVKTEAD